MIPRDFFLRCAAGRLLALLLSFTLWSVAAAEKDGPTISSTKFENRLENVFYFDDSNILLGHDREEGVVYRSTNAGADWEKVDDDDQAGKVWDLWPHPFDNKRAYILGLDRIHWITTDQGESWRKFDSQSGNSLLRGSPLTFHGRDPNKVMWQGQKCPDIFNCEQVTYYTVDDFETIHEVGAGTKQCYWAVSTPEFGEDIAPEIQNRIFCIVHGLYSSWPKDQRLLVSDDFFKNHQVEPLLDGDRTVTGVLSMAAVKKYVVAATRSDGTDELALFVTDDSSQWHRAVFGDHRIEEDAYTILESTKYSIQVDVLGSRPMNPMGHLFTSNSNGTYFTKNIDHTNRNLFGTVDFEKISNIQGIVLVNVVRNWEEVEGDVNADKEVVSKISFDDGRTFQELKVLGSDKQLHLHSVTDSHIFGRIFSSPAPGIVMGIGNVGSYLKSYDDGDLYVSDDAGLTWREALNGPYRYEFGNQGAVLVAVKDDEPTDVIQYSLNHGKDWLKAELDVKINARILTTAPDSTTLKFLLIGSSGSGSKTEWYVFKIDFEGLHERTCNKDKDFDRWPARVDKDLQPSCMMGHKQFYQRRKADAECFIDGEFKDPVPEFEPCTCTKEDFECDYNFVRSEDRTECVPAGVVEAPAGECASEDDTFMGSSGWRLIPGNECVRTGGEELDQKIKRPCSDSYKKPVSGQIGTTKTYFNADRFSEWHYMERTESSTGDDETIILRTSEQEIFLTRNHGKTWERILKDEDITAIFTHPHLNDAVYFLTGSRTVYYSIDRAAKIHSFTAPERPSNVYPTLRFHPEYKDWMLWSGAVGTDGHTNVFYTKDRGDDWNTLVRYARKCEFITRDGRGPAEELIYCEQYENEDPDKPLQLKSSTNWFADETLHFPDILAFATMSEFIIVAARTDDRQSLKVDASVDGFTFAAAEFPKNFQVAHQQAYTVLESSTHAVFLHVTVNAITDRQYGTIIKSNSNGTSYVLTLGGVNRDNDGYVDFEKMSILEGVAMVNVVGNVEETNEGSKKKLKSMITHNDGAQWALIPPPKKDALGKDYACVREDNVASEKCSLHTHSYTERLEKSATFSSPSAVGLMVAVGNVGEYLARKDDESTDTFITRDAGITWTAVKKGSYMWEFGDQGSIIVIVEEANPTKVVFYSLNEGKTWVEYEFSDVPMQIASITTVPSDNSRNFLLWGKETGPTAKRAIVTVNLDFSSLTERQRQCILSETATTNDDYELWEPQHPMQGVCLFGHVAQYHRKKPEAECYNGRAINHLHKIARNCSCTRQDFECAYNYEANADGTCTIVPGTSPVSPEGACKEDPGLIEYWGTTGYRRIPLTTCEGGRELDKVEAFPCPGHEKQYEQKHRLSGAGLFFAITIPILAGAAVGYWVWQKWHEGMFGFGQIRLGDSATGTSTARGESVLVAIPVAIIAGTWAVARAAPLLAMSLWRSARGYMPVGSGGSGGHGYRDGAATSPYTSRGAFASRRQDYSSVVDDEDELLGADLDDGEDV